MEAMFHYGGKIETQKITFRHEKAEMSKGDRYFCDNRSPCTETYVQTCPSLWFYYYVRQYSLNFLSWKSKIPSNSQFEFKISLPRLSYGPFCLKNTCLIMWMSKGKSYNETKSKLINAITFIFEKQNIDFVIFTNVDDKINYNEHLGETFDTSHILKLFF